VRTFLTVLAGIIAGCLAFLAMSISLAWWTAGTAGNLASTVVSTLDASGGAQALGSALVDQALASAPEAERAALQQRSAELSVVAGEALSAAREPLTKVISAAFSAIADGVRVVVDLGPVLRPVLAALHKVDAGIPATLDGSANIELDGSALGALSTLITLLGLWWVAVLLAIALLVATAFASKHRGWRRLRPAGIALAVPALLVVLISLVTMAAPTDQGSADVALAFIDAALTVVRTKGIVISLVAGLIAAALIGLSFIRRSQPGEAGPAIESASGSAPATG